MPVNLDWSKAESSGFEAVEEGEYDATISDIVEKTSKSNNQMFEFTFTLQHADYKNQRIWQTCSLLPQAMFKLYNLLVKMGMTGEEIQSFGSSTKLLQEVRRRYLGKKVLLTVGRRKRESGEGFSNTVEDIEVLDPVEAGNNNGSGASDNLWG